VSAFGREGDDNDIGLVRECPELIGFVRTVAINEEEDWVIIHLVGSGGGDERVPEPTQAELVVSPPVVRGGDDDVHRWVEDRDGSLGKDEGWGN
jgi:hypothetical protein